jgi:flavodoxin
MGVGTLKTLIVYDSVFTNTEQIAKAMGSALNAPKDSVIRAADIKPEQLTGLELLIVGSPTRKFQPMPTVTKFLKAIPQQGLKGIKVAAFDTRMGDIKQPILRFIVKIAGYAAKPLADRLKQKGGNLVLAPEGFLVIGSEGPLKDGELKRAADWVKQIK